MKTFFDGFTHSWDREQIEGLLKSVPIFLSDDDGVMCFAGDKYGLVVGRVLLHKSVEGLLGFVF